MKAYKFYIKKDLNGKYEDLISVKGGFNVYAFILWPFYLFYKKMWKKGIIYLSFYILISIFSKNSTLNFLTESLRIGIALHIAFEFSDWLEEYLISKGYELSGESYGKNEQDAQQRILDKINSQKLDTNKGNVF